MHPTTLSCSRKIHSRSQVYLPNDVPQTDQRDDNDDQYRTAHVPPPLPNRNISRINATAKMMINSAVTLASEMIPSAS